jgi:protein-tyrosine phosphatase
MLVRLNGPVRGRGAICRDLAQDLMRIKDLGVGCIVWYTLLSKSDLSLLIDTPSCLDDEELDFLGVPWAEYAATARAHQLDILRIPIPEGLPPDSPASFDTQLLTLIERYTLQGTHVLVHCRGGVGRAGLVACCWALRLGLCFSPAHHDGEDDAGGVRLRGDIREDTLSLVERIIGVVRRRRSLKAIETYEQVRFLVDYVDYMRSSPIVG